MQRFHFPIVIIDEDFRSENASGLGIRALAQAIEAEGFEVTGTTSYGDLSQFAQQQSRASAFILSIDDEEIGPEGADSPAIVELRRFIQEIRRKNAEIPIYLYGETRTSEHIPNDVLRELAQVPGSAFEAVDVSSLMVDPNSGATQHLPPEAYLPSLQNP